MLVKYITLYRKARMSKSIKYESWQEDLKVYNPKALADKLGISVNTVYTRFRSKQSRKLWGVTLYKLPNGSYKKFVPEQALVKWTNSPEFRGRPVRDIARGQDN